MGILRTIFSIGHSNQEVNEFLSLLKRHGIEVVVDVRSHPYSRHARQFNGPHIKAELMAEGIKYIYLGKELGGMPEEDEFYDAAGFVLYGRMAQSRRFIEGLDRLEKGSEKYRVAVMCSEEDPAICHRHLLLGRALNSRGIDYRHIRKDGRLQSENELENSPGGLGLQARQIYFSGTFEAMEETAWKSIQSVTRKKQPENSLRA